MAAVTSQHETPPGGTGGAHETGVRSAIDAAAVSHLFEQVATATVINLVLIALLWLALWEHVATPLLLGWGTLVVVLVFARLAISLGYHRAARPEPQAWLRRNLVVVAMLGLAWGLSAPLFVPAAPPVQDLVVIIAIAGLAAGALAVNAAVPRVYFTYVTMTLTPVALTFLALGDRTHLILAAMSGLYAFGLLIGGRSYSRHLARANELAVQLNTVNHELERRASHDPLTGLWNRQRFEAALDAELDRVSRYGSSCSLIMLDVDHFKQVNDSYGHDIGDRVLREVATTLDRQMRTPDQLARWGGEEFMVLLPQTGNDAAAAVAERLRRDVAGARLSGPGTVTISLGVTTISGPEERSTLLKRLDDALYRAKQDGRNCVRVGPEPER